MNKTIYPNAGSILHREHLTKEQNFIRDIFQNNYQDLVGVSGVVKGGGVTLVDVDDGSGGTTKKFQIAETVAYNETGNRIYVPADTQIDLKREGDVPTGAITQSTYKIVVRHTTANQEEAGVSFVSDRYELFKRSSALEEGDVHLADIDASDQDNIIVTDKRYKLKSYAKESKSMPPARIPMPFLPGHFTGTNNASFVLDGPSANTSEAINAYLKSQGYDNWRVCDGTAPNDPASPYFNTPNKYLPNLTDDRFIMGSTSSGTIGGQNSIIITISQMPRHGHTAHHDHSNTIHDHVLHIDTGGGGSAPTRYVLSGPTTRVFPNISSREGMDRTTIGTPFKVLNTSFVGSGHPIENRPKYLQCFYIMRIK